MWSFICCSCPQTLERFICLSNHQAPFKSKLKATSKLVHSFIFYSLSRRGVKWTRLMNSVPGPTPAVTDLLRAIYIPQFTYSCRSLPGGVSEENMWRTWRNSTPKGSGWVVWDPCDVTEARSYSKNLCNAEHHVV